MARNLYGATSADFTLTSGGRPIPNQTLTLWTARTGGTQITDLTDIYGTATTTVTSGADASIAYYGPDNDKSAHWAQAPQGNRFAIRPVDITGEAGPGSGILTTKGDILVRHSDADTRLPVGADGKLLIADSTQTTGLGWVSIGNLLTANQASGGDTLGTTAGWLGYNATVSRETGTYLQGNGCLKAVVTTSPGTVYTATGTSGVPVVWNDATYTVSLFVLASVGTPTVTPAIEWFDSGGSSLGQTNGGSVASNGAWQRVSLSAKPPTYAAFASPRFAVAGSVSDAILADCLSFHRGAAGQWAMPGQVIPGTSHIADNGAFQTSGTAAPEGVITAPPLSRYLQTSGAVSASGAMEWVKATGTGNTGWVAGAEADTGWRDVSSLLLNGWAAGGAGMCLVRRIGRQVNWLFQYINGASATNDVLLAPPAGFRTNGISVFRAGNVVGAFNVRGTPQIDTSLRDAAIYVDMTHTTDNAWPSSLPGTAA